MLRLFRKSSKTENPNSFAAGAHIEVWVQAEGFWAFGLYQRPVPVDNRHLVAVYVDGDWYPLAVYADEIIPSTWGWHDEQQ
jgi:hypothetical protein